MEIYLYYHKINYSQDNLTLPFKAACGSFQVPFISIFLTFCELQQRQTWPGWSKRLFRENMSIKKNTGLFSEKMDIGWKSPYFWFFEKYLIHDFAYCRNDYALVLCYFIGYDVSIFRSSSDSWITRYMLQKNYIWEKAYMIVGVSQILNK